MLDAPRSIGLNGTSHTSFHHGEHPMPIRPAPSFTLPASGRNTTGIPAPTEQFATRRALVSVFWAMLVGNLLIVALIYRISAQHERAIAYDELKAIAEQQAQTLQRWQQSKIDATLPSLDEDRNHTAASLLAVLRGTATEVQQQQARAGLRNFALTQAATSLLALSTEGKVVLAAAEPRQLHPSSLRQLRTIALRSRREMLSPYRNERGQMVSDIVMPVVDRHQLLAGFLIITVDLAESLQGILSQRYRKTETGHTALVLNQPSGSLVLDSSSTANGIATFRPVPDDDPALQRVAANSTASTFESVSKDGKHVLVATRPIADTPWTLISRIDVDEALAGARQQIIYLAAGSLLLVLLCGFTVMRLWRLQSERDQARWAEERLRQDELQLLQDRLNEAQRFGKIGSWERDLTSGDIWWSAGMYSLYNVGPKNVPHNLAEVLPLIHPEDQDRFLTATESRLEPGERGAIEFRTFDPEGQTRHVLHQWHRVFDDRGSPLKLVGTTQDISERVKSDAALREQLDMLNTLIENVPGGVTLFDRDLRLRFHNRQFQILLDFPDDLFKEDAPGFETFVRYNAWRGEYGPGDPEAIVAEHMKRAAEPTAHVFERDRPDGTSIEIRGAPLQGGGLVTIYTDITARKQAEQRQLLSEKIIATSPTAILITDPRNRIVFVNPAFTAITGFSFADVAGQDPKALASGRHDKAFYAELWQSLSRDDHWSGEIWDRRKDGSIYPKWLSVYTLRNAAGRLTNYVAMFTDITERKQAEQRIHHLAHHDPLTGLANRMALEIKLDQAIADALRNGRKVALLFIDLDRFKMVNDSLGHAIGDLMLMEIAGRLTERLRGSDIVARLGGDEFVVVLPELPDVQHAALVAQTLLEDLARPIKTPVAELHTSGSVGIAIYPDDGHSVEALMQSADTAMYEAKSAGRNAFRFFTRGMTDSANQRLQTENDLRSALIKEQFELHYQPQVAPLDGRIVGVEALLRWKHPVNGMVGPDRFVPIAEETGLIVDIGAWVLREGCRQARVWIDAGFAIRMSINLSARQLRSENLLPLIEKTLTEHQLPTHALELEITESALMEQPEQAVTILKAIKALGVALALDDFGTGYSSLAYLKRFPIDRLKIDRSFVRDIETDPNDRAIALSTIALAHSLGLQVTAEGVEEIAQRDFLRQHGCNDAQGWYYSKAVPADVAEALLRKAYLP